MKVVSFDPIWNKIYDDGHQNRAPWDTVVSFIFRYKPKNIPHSKINILEVGCGVGNNLLFASAEGFAVFGIDGSQSGITLAKARFAEHGYNGDFHVGDFSALPFENNSMDLVVDRAALTCAGASIQKKAIAEIHRVLKKDGHFLYTPYATDHDSYKNSIPGPDGVRENISAGTLVGVGQIGFVSAEDIADRLSENQWVLIEKNHIVEEDLLVNKAGKYAAWKIVAKKVL